MKKVICIVLVLLASLVAVANAEVDISQMSLKEMIQLRTELNKAIADHIRNEYEAPEGKTLAELFPDTWIARKIRDQLGKFSTKDIVSQEELDTITSLRIDGQTVDNIQVSSLEGLQYLRNLTRLEVNMQNSIFDIPEWIGSLQNLIYLEFRYCPIKTIPDSVCNLITLKTLNLYGSDLESLPTDIGNLTNLENLNIAHTKITELPSSIYNLSLNKLFSQS